MSEKQTISERFKSRAEYDEYLAKQKGFKSHAELQRKRYRDYRTKEKIEKTKKEDELLLRKTELLKKRACTILKEHHKSTKDDPESLTTDFIQKQIGIVCDYTKKQKN